MEILPHQLLLSFGDVWKVWALTDSSACSPWSFNVMMMMSYTEPGVGVMWEQLSPKLFALSEMLAHDTSSLRVKPASSRPVCPWGSRVQEISLLLLGPLLFSPVWLQEPPGALSLSIIFPQSFLSFLIVAESWKRAQVWGMLKSNSCPNSTLPSCSPFWEVGWGGMSSSSLIY